MKTDEEIREEYKAFVHPKPDNGLPMDPFLEITYLHAYKSAQSSMEAEKQIWKDVANLFINMREGMAELFMQHNYRYMYELYRSGLDSAIDKLKPILNGQPLPPIVDVEAGANKWAPLAKISDSPEKWMEMYGQYQDMLTKEDVAAWYQEQFQMQCKLREEAEANIDRRAKEKVEEWKKEYKIRLADKLFRLSVMSDIKSGIQAEGILMAIELLKPSEGENHE